MPSDAPRAGALPTTAAGLCTVLRHERQYIGLWTVQSSDAPGWRGSTSS